MLPPLQKCYRTSGHVLRVLPPQYTITHPTIPTTNARHGLEDPFSVFVKMKGSCSSWRMVKSGTFLITSGLDRDGSNVFSQPMKDFGLEVVTTNRYSLQLCKSVQVYTPALAFLSLCSIRLDPKTLGCFHLRDYRTLEICYIYFLLIQEPHLPDKK